MKKFILKILTRIIIFVVAVVVVVIMIKELKQPSSLVINSEPKSRPDHLTQPTNRPKPNHEETLNPNQRPLESLTQALLPAKLVAPKEELPFL